MHRKMIQCLNTNSLNIISGSNILKPITSFMLWENSGNPDEVYFWFYSIWIINFENIVRWRTVLKDCMDYSKAFDNFSLIFYEVFLFELVIALSTAIVSTKSRSSLMKFIYIARGEDLGRIEWNISFNSRLLLTFHEILVISSAKATNISCIKP